MGQFQQAEAALDVLFSKTKAQDARSVPVCANGWASYAEVTLFMNSIPARRVMAHSVLHRAGVGAARMTQGERTQAEAVEDMAASKLLLVEDGLPPAPDRARAVGNANIAVLRQSSA